MIYPAAFNTTTGPMHWTLLQRSRWVTPVGVLADPLVPTTTKSTWPCARRRATPVPRTRL